MKNFPPRVMLWKPKSTALPEYCGWAVGSDPNAEERGAKEYLSLKEHEETVSTLLEALKKAQSRLCEHCPPAISGEEPGDHTDECLDALDAIEGAGR